MEQFDDLVDGAKHLVDMGLVDEKKVGVTGGSYGGYATAWCSTALTEHFAAGVMFVGISNKISKFGTTDIPREETLVHALALPWEKWQFFLERSPLYHVERCRTPLLIMGGDADPRVSPTQSEELYRALKTLDQAPVRLVRYPGEGHGNARAASRFDYQLRLLRWFDHFVRGAGDSLPPYRIDYLSREHGWPAEDDRKPVL
jgi:dipeptidyl aminopeptidase/acylaminoacyl peptidase